MIGTAAIGTFAISTQEAFSPTWQVVALSPLLVPAASFGTAFFTSFDLRVLFYDFVVRPRSTTWRVK